MVLRAILSVVAFFVALIFGGTMWASGDKKITRILGAVICIGFLALMVWSIGDLMINGTTEDRLWFMFWMN